MFINVKGQGCSINLEFIPDKINIGPCLPYNKKAYSILQIRNNSDYDTKLYSLDFNGNYLKDEEELLKYDELVAGEPIYLPVRGPTDPFWETILKTNQDRKKIAELEDQLAHEIEEDKKDEILKMLDEFKQKKISIEYPKKVEDDVMQHCIIFGPPGSGKTHLARQLAKEHKRGIINMNELLDWNLQRNTQASIAASEYLELMQKNKENIIAEREKLFKKAGKKGKALEEQMGPVDEASYLFLNEKIIVDMLVERYFFF